MSRDSEDPNRRLLRARDATDRAYAERLDVRAVAAVAHVSEASRVQHRRCPRPVRDPEGPWGSDFTQEPTDHFYGTDMGLRDPFGNPIRILQQGKAPHEPTA